jgi:hypothetical protein
MKKKLYQILNAWLKSSFFGNKLNGDNDIAMDGDMDDEEDDDIPSDSVKGSTGCAEGASTACHVGEALNELVVGEEQAEFADECIKSNVCKG